MRIAVLGAGAMGSWFGGHLVLAGHDVHLLTTNEPHIAAVKKDGLRLCSDEADIRVTPDIGKPDELTGNVDLVLVLTKTFQLDAALRSISGALGKSTALLSLQNGLGNAEVMARYVSINNVWVGVTMLPVDKLAPGVVQAKGAGTTWFGHAGNANTEMTSTIDKVFQTTSLDVQQDQEIKKRIWGKAAFNVGMNAVCALTHSTPGLIQNCQQARQIVRSAAAEAISVAAAEGVVLDPKSVNDTIDFACAEHGDHVPSMLQDLLDGKQTEVDALNGAVVKRGRVMGIDTPVNSMLESLITLAECGHRRIQ